MDIEAEANVIEKRGRRSTFISLARTTAAFAYTAEDKIGSGTYGHVWKATEKATGNVVALKKIRMENEKEGFPITAIREIKILKSLDHRNVISLKEVVTSEDATDLTSIFLVFEYIDHDLAGLLDSSWKRTLELEHIKCYVKQLLEALLYLHTNMIVHRDIKSANILISNNGTLKLADFGLARPVYLDSEVAENPKKGIHTPNVVTLWYRAPEILLGCNTYSFPIDMWSAGCIVAELLTKKPLFAGARQESEQLHQIYSLLGTPTDESWPEHKDMPFYKTMKPVKHLESRLAKVFQSEKLDTIEILESFLTINPQNRLTALEALDANWFWEDPLPCEPEDLQPYEVHSHEYTVKRKRGEPLPEEHREIYKKHKQDGGPPRGVSSSGWKGAPSQPNNDRTHK